MGIFGKLRLPAWDQAEGNPHVTPGLQLLAAEDWDGLAAIYRSLAPSDRYHFIQGLGRLSTVDSDLPTDMDDPALAAILAGIRIGWAWRHRGSAPASDVTQIGFDNMRRCLRAAEPMLAAASDVASGDTTITACQIRCEMGLGGDYAVLAKLTHRLSQANEHNIFAALNHLMFVAPKWHGSIEEMWKTANMYAGKPHNAAWVAMAARAHVEEWLYSFSLGEDRDLQIAYSNKLHDPAFREFAGTIDALFWETLDITPAMTGSEAVVAHNNMAGLLVMVQAIDLSRRHFQCIGPYMTETPLGYFSRAENPIEALNGWRKRTGLPLLKA